VLPQHLLGVRALSVDVTQMREGASVAVVGAGIAGLAAAHDLYRAGYRPTVFESRDRVGGRILTVDRGDFRMDLGTAVYLGTYKAAIELIHEIGLGDQFTERDATCVIPRDGRNHYLDLTRPVRAGLATRALTVRDKLTAVKLGATLVRHRASLGYDRYERLAEVDTETTDEYCERVLSRSVRDYLGRPLVSGTWVADPRETSAALLLWTVRNMLVPNVYNLTTGVGGLTDALAAEVGVRCSTPVLDVTDTGPGVEVTAVVDGTERTESFDAAVIATTARPALSMYPQMDDNHRTLYETARYRRLGNVALGLSRRPDDPGTFYLVPPSDDPDVTSVVIDHNKAPNRAPEGKGLVTVLLSHDYLERTDDEPDETLLARGVQAAERYLGPLSDDVEEHAEVRWAESVPAIDTGRFKLIAEFTRKVDPTRRVQLASDLDRIPGLNGALVSGREAARRVMTAVPAGPVATEGVR
jgi:protoporphyrinogen/coproporphyrinogen III oxidase